MPFEIVTQNLHPTTESCLEALQWLNERHGFANMLEMGCGSGVLSLVAANLWQAPVLAADIAEKAVADAQAQVSEYALSDLITVIRSDGFSHPLIDRRKPYDMIICNMLAQQLISMARDLHGKLSLSGIALLSGILSWQVADTKHAYQSLGFEFIHEITAIPWHTLILRLSGSRPDSQPS